MCVFVYIYIYVGLLVDNRWNKKTNPSQTEEAREREKKGNDAKCDINNAIKRKWEDTALERQSLETSD